MRQWNTIVIALGVTLYMRVCEALWSEKSRLLATSTGWQSWAVQYGSSGRDDPFAIHVDMVGEVYVTGQTYGSLYGSNEGGADFFVAKFNGSTGVFIA